MKKYKEPLTIILITISTILVAYVLILNVAPKWIIYLAYPDSREGNNLIIHNSDSKYVVNAKDLCPMVSSHYCVKISCYKINTFYPQYIATSSGETSYLDDINFENCTLNRLYGRSN